MRRVSHCPSPHRSPLRLAIACLLGSAPSLVSIRAQALETTPQASSAVELQADTQSGAHATRPSESPSRDTSPIEFGIYSGALFVSPGHVLHSRNLEQQAYSGPAFELGARLAYYPLAYLGLEGDFSLGDARFGDDLSESDGRLTANRGTLSAYRAQLVGQLPGFAVVPYALVGLGALSASSQAQGRNTDFLFHFGGGVKVPLSEGFALRAELRENLHNRESDRYAGVAFSEEVNVGVAFGWGAPAERPVPDSDRDGLSDDRDKCPLQASLAADGCPGDSDGDGVGDSADACPEEPGDLDSGCPNTDADDDGVHLPCDQCPEEKGVAPTGCRDEDPDRDGVIGEADECPLEPETRNGYEDSDGCPDEVPREVQKFTGTMRGISFAIGKATVEASSEPTLQDAAEILKRHPSIRVEISGHTSSEGSVNVNQKLSEERARSVRQWLIDAGVDPNQLEARGAGASEPMGDNATADGRQMNRRIEFRILGGVEPKTAR